MNSVVQVQLSSHMMLHLGMLSWTSGVADNVLYPALFLEYLKPLIPVLHNSFLRGVATLMLSLVCVLACCLRVSSCLTCLCCALAPDQQQTAGLCIMVWDLYASDPDPHAFRKPSSHSSPQTWLCWGTSQGKVSEVTICTFSASQPSIFPLLLFAQMLTNFAYLGLDIVGTTSVGLMVFTMLPFGLLVFMGIPQIMPELWFEGFQWEELVNNSDVHWNTYLNTLFWNLNYFDSVSCLAGVRRICCAVFWRAVSWNDSDVHPCMWTCVGLHVCPLG